MAEQGSSSSGLANSTQITIRLVGFSLTWLNAFGFSYTAVFMPSDYLSPVQIDVLCIAYLFFITFSQFLLSVLSNRLMPTAFRVPLLGTLTSIIVVEVVLYAALPAAPWLSWLYVAAVSMSGAWQGVAQVLWAESFTLLDRQHAAKAVYGGIALGTVLLLAIAAFGTGYLPYAVCATSICSLALYVFDCRNSKLDTLSTDLPSRKLKKGLQKSSAAFIVFGALLGACIYSCVAPDAAHSVIGTGMGLCLGALAMLLVNAITDRIFGLDEVTIVFAPAVAIVLLVQVYLSGNVGGVLLPLLVLILTAFDSTAFCFQLSITRALGLCPFSSIARGRSFVQTGMFLASGAYCLVERFASPVVNTRLLIPLMLVAFLFVVMATCSRTDFMPRALVDKPLLELEPSDAPAAEPPKPVDVVSRICEDYDLSARERDVLELLLGGYTIAGIAEKLVISQNTVKSHCYHIYRKMAINSKQELINIRDQYELRYKAL